MTYLKHGAEVPCTVTFMEHFYDGSIKIIATVCEVPADKPHWTSRLKGLGYKEISKAEFRQARGLPLEEVPTTQRTPRQPR